MKHHAIQKQFEFKRSTLNMNTAFKRQPCFEDLDTLWFGKHKGEPLQDVPVTYLKWLWDSELKDYSGRELNPHSKPPEWLYNKVRLANYLWNCSEDLSEELGEPFV